MTQRSRHSIARTVVGRRDPLQREHEAGSANSPKGKHHLGGGL